MKVFEELLLDADWSVNAGMWMWLSCSSFFQQFFHCYCPVRFGRKADPNGDYIRRYLPVLKNFPTRYIHEPWNAPESVQKAAKCIIGKEYSLPMVNHAVASRINIERMKQVYQQLSKYRGPGLLATVPTSLPQTTAGVNQMSALREFKKSPPSEGKWEKSPPDSAVNSADDPMNIIQFHQYCNQQQRSNYQSQEPGDCE
ncbi:hypothetical protein L9F63_004693 [Diploptera punctata]|uniref:Cryptochrome/DNA photolyase FAD-binding domain-containing protein n=1 Tax=Diploptera punctata TaxID=6984 RepID=A0AAD8E7I3_DIPPU|nr:hypothetical protein L9F63_004693 [Diploptera punctata]